MSPRDTFLIVAERLEDAAREFPPGYEQCPALYREWMVQARASLPQLVAEVRRLSEALSEANDELESHDRDGCRRCKPIAHLHATPEQTAMALLTAERERLREACAGALWWLDDDGGDATATFERVADAFYQDTGYLRPGKDAPAAMGDQHRAQTEWDRWVVAKRVRVVGTLRAALSTPAPGEPAVVVPAPEKPTCETCNGSGRASSVVLLHGAAGTVAAFLPCPDCAGGKEARRFVEKHDRTHEKTTPIPMRLTCPQCGQLHVDAGEFATKPHHTHSCQSCGPGFKNEERPINWKKGVLPHHIRVACVDCGITSGTNAPGT